MSRYPMNQLHDKVALVKDNATREVLKEIVDELVRIQSIHAVTEDTESLANAINRITKKLR